MAGTEGRTGLYDLALERLGQDKVDEIVCEAIGADAASYPKVLEAYRKDGCVELDMFLDYRDRDFIEDKIRERAAGLYERYRDRADAPTGQELYQELEDTSGEFDRLWDDDVYERQLVIAGKVSDMLGEALGLDGASHGKVTLEDLDDYGLYPDLEVGSILEGMEFPVTLMLDSAADRVGNEMCAMRHAFDRALKALDEASDPDLKGDPVRDGVPGFEFGEGLADAEASSLGRLCRTQGCSLEEVVQGGGGEFGESLRNEILEAGACEGAFPHVVVMCTLGARQFCDMTASACGARGERALLDVLPGMPEGFEKTTGVGIYDPVNGACGDLAIRLARPIEVTGEDVGHVIPDYHRVENGKEGRSDYLGWWPMEECCGFGDPTFWRHPVEEPISEPCGIAELADGAQVAAEAQGQGAPEAHGKEGQER